MKKLWSVFLSAALLLALFPLVSPAAEATTPEAEELYRDFLVSGGYEPYLEDCELLVGEPDLYSISDLNGDGTPELLIDSNDGWAFNTTFVFTLDETHSKVEFLNSIYSCGGISYSKAYNCVVYAYPKPTAMEGSLGFYAMTEDDFVISFSVYFENYNGEHYYLLTYDEKGSLSSETELTAGEFDAYVKTQKSLKWEPLPEISASVPSQQAQQSNLVKLYLPAVETAIEEGQVYGWNPGATALTDLDQDGTPELIMCYTAKLLTEYGNPAPYNVCTICTIRDGKAVTVLYKEILFVEAGGAGGNVSVVEKDGQRYAALYSYVGETGTSPTGLNQDGSWTLYALRDGSMTPILEATLSWVELSGNSVDYSRSSAVIDGRSCSYQEYETLRDSYTDILSLYSYGNEEILTLADRAEALRNMADPHPPETQPAQTEPTPTEAPETEPPETEAPRTEPAETVPIPTDTPETNPVPQPEPAAAPRWKQPLVIGLAALCLLLTVAGLYHLLPRKGFLICLAALAAIVIGLGVFLLWNPGQQQEVTQPSATQTDAPQIPDTALPETNTVTPPPETAATQPPETVPTTAPVETEPPKAENPYARCEEGDRLFFGTFEQDGNYRTSDPIEWRVLEKKNGRLLLISEMALDCRQYHGKGTSVTWADCDLRAWLNGNFYRSAFSDQEKELILLTEVPADDNSAYKVSGGSDTQDYIFIPSVQDMERYFDDSNDRMCWPTAIAVQNKAYQEPNTGYSTWWLLRTPGNSAAKVANINCDGIIDMMGSTVESPYGAIRIMLWLSTEE